MLDSRTTSTPRSIPPDGAASSPRRRRRPRTQLACGAVLLLAAGLVACSNEELTSGSAACAAPQLTVEPASAAPGEQVTITGDALWNGCADVSTVDEHGNITANETMSLMGPLTVAMTAGERTWELATGTPDDHGQFTLTATVPADAPVGTAQVRASDLERVVAADLEIAAAS